MYIMTKLGETCLCHQPELKICWMGWDSNLETPWHESATLPPACHWGCHVHCTIHSCFCTDFSSLKLLLLLFLFLLFLNQRLYIHTQTRSDVPRCVPLVYIKVFCYLKVYTAAASCHCLCLTYARTHLVCPTQQGTKTKWCLHLDTTRVHIIT